MARGKVRSWSLRFRVRSEILKFTRRCGAETHSRTDQSEPVYGPVWFRRTVYFVCEMLLVKVMEEMDDRKQPLSIILLQRL